VGEEEDVFEFSAGARLGREGVRYLRSERVDALDAAADSAPLRPTAARILDNDGIRLAKRLDVLS